MFLPGATYEGVRYDVNETHYTVVCSYDNQYLPLRTMFIIFTFLQYVIPMFIIIRTSISIIITVWRRVRMPLDVQRDNGIKMKLRAATIRSTCIIIALTFAFIIPCLVYFAQVSYHNVTKATIDFETAYIIRYSYVKPCC